MMLDATATLSRRTLLIELAAAAVAPRAFAQPSAPPRGPKVFLDYDQAELDRAYDQRHWAPNMEAVLRRYAINSDTVRAQLGPPKTVAYGATAAETLDIYATPRTGAPIMIFVHGGAWRTGRARDSAFPAEMFVRAGAHYVAPDFATVMDVGLDGMVAQVRRAIAWVAKNAHAFGGDPGRIHLAGHSSGGHLAGVALITDWAAFGVAPDVIKGAVLVSGMYDLRGPRLSARSRYVRFDDRIEEEFSIQRHLDRVVTPLIIGYGDQESPEFQRQSREFAEALKSAGKPVTVVIGRGYNHFEFIETLANPYGILGRAALALMKLA
jgi:arylformamidase